MENYNEMCELNFKEAFVTGSTNVLISPQPALLMTFSALVRSQGSNSVDEVEDVQLTLQ